MRFLLLFTLGACVLFVSCAGSAQDERKAPSSVELAEMIPPSMRAQNSVDSDFAPIALPGDEQKQSAPVSTLAGLPALPSADDIIWTDPDNPDQNLGSVEQAFTKPAKGPWRLSYREALRESYAREMPLLIWFTNSRSSPTCKTLSRQLFSQTEFDDWAEKNIVRLRIDAMPKESKLKLRKRKIQYVNALKKRFNVNGHPTVLVIAPDGAVIGRYKGFKSGSGSYYWGRIKNATKTVDEGFYDWVIKMRGKGYRTWTGKNGVTLFAKLRRYKAPRLQVVEPDGTKTVFKEENLSASDRQWLADEKKKRGKS